jgi:hypothetical protein
VFYITRYSVLYNEMSDVYYSLIVDDDDGSSDVDEGVLDTQWIRDYENDILFSEYELFLKSDITRVSFRFIYLDRDKKCVLFVIPAEAYSLQRANQITQTEIFQIVHRHQKMGKKYYNFHSLMLYDFQLEDGNRSVAEYISSPGGSSDVEFGRIIEYTNILSFDTIYFQPLIAMFHDLIGFTVVLYED